MAPEPKKKKVGKKKKEKELSKMALESDPESAHSLSPLRPTSRRWTWLT